MLFMYVPFGADMWLYQLLYMHYDAIARQ